MSTPSTDSDPLMAALADADPGRGVSVSADSGERLIRAALAEGAPRRRPRRRWMPFAVAIASILGVGVPATAIGTGFIAQTGWFANPNPGSPEGTIPLGTESDGSEWVDITAPDYVQFAASIWPSYAVLPDGYTADDFAAAIAERTVSANERYDNGVTTYRQVTGILAQFEQFARCAWRGEWLDANAEGDTARERIAASVLTEAASWPATSASDGGGIVEGERAVADAATSRDRTAVEHVNSWLCTEMLRSVGR